MNNYVVVLIGLSSVGKDTVRERLNALGYENATSHTTRKMREGEVNGREYHFISEDEFFTMQENEEFTKCNNEYKTCKFGKWETSYYALSKKALESDKNLVTILTYDGAKKLKEYLGDRLIAIYLYADDEIRKQRCIKRGDFCKKEWVRREKADKESFKGIENDIDLIDLWLPSDSAQEVADRIHRLVTMKKQLVLINERIKELS